MLTVEHTKLWGDPMTDEFITKLRFLKKIYTYDELLSRLKLEPGYKSALCCWTTGKRRPSRLTVIHLIGKVRDNVRVCQRDFSVEPMGVPRG